MFNVYFNNISPVAFRGATQSNKVEDTKSEKTEDLSFKFGTIRHGSEKLYKGNINGVEYDLTYKNNLLGPDVITGTINGKRIEMQHDRSLASRSSWGSFDGQDVRIDIPNLTNFGKIKGCFNGKDINYELKSGVQGFQVCGEDAELKITNHFVYSKDMEVNGVYSGDKELLPILMTLINAKCEQQMAEFGMAAM